MSSGPGRGRGEVSRGEGGRREGGRDVEREGGREGESQSSISTHRMRDLQEQNTRLKAQVQAKLTFQPSQSSAGAICCDSSGAVTSAATYHLRGEVAKARERGPETGG